MSPLGGWVYYFLMSIPLLIGVLMYLSVILGIVLIGMGVYRRHQSKSYRKYLVFGSVLLSIATLIIGGFIGLFLIR